jgi:hypothetical protein
LDQSKLKKLKDEKIKQHPGIQNNNLYSSNMLTNAALLYLVMKPNQTVHHHHHKNKQLDEQLDEQSNNESFFGGLFGGSSKKQQQEQMNYDLPESDPCYSTYNNAMTCLSGNSNDSSKCKSFLDKFNECASFYCQEEGSDV